AAMGDRSLGPAFRVLASGISASLMFSAGLFLGQGIASADPAVAHKCHGYTVTMAGTPGKDHLVGTPGRDVILAKGGDDVVKGGGGNDVLCGDTGTDTVVGGPGDDVMFAATGNDTFL